MVLFPVNIPIPLLLQYVHLAFGKSGTSGKLWQRTSPFWSALCTEKIWKYALQVHLLEPGEDPSQVHYGVGEHFVLHKELVLSSVGGMCSSAPWPEEFSSRHL